MEESREMLLLLPLSFFPFGLPNRLGVLGVDELL
jgi:hypothetical protein